MSEYDRWRRLRERTFTVPAVLALVSGIGLVAALVYEGSFDVLASLAIAVPLAAIAWASHVRRR